MALLNGGSLIGWLLAGLLWGATVCFFFSFFMVIACRELSTTVPLQEGAALPERLGKVAKSIRYTVEQLSPTTFVCKPKHGLARLFSLEYAKIHVQLREYRTNTTAQRLILHK
jgi:hypothetical protein